MQPHPTPTPRPERVETRPITFQTNVGGVSIYIDGEFAGRTSDNWDDVVHTLEIRVEVGTRFITLTKDGFHPSENNAIFINENLRSQQANFTMHPIN
jgi:hypothetical protein